MKQIRALVVPILHGLQRRHDAVLLSAKDWQAIQETLYLLSVPGMRQSAPYVVAL